MARTSKDTKTHKPAIVGGMPLMIGAPYVTQEQYSQQTGLSKEAIRLRLDKGIIARYQPVEGGTIFVNVLAEFQKTAEAKTY